jgi:hypothetical protein
MYGYGEHFEKRLRERFGWDWDELIEQQRGKTLDVFRTSEELERKYVGFGEKIRNNETKIFIVEQLNFLGIKVGLEWKTCYHLY